MPTRFSHSLIRILAVALIPAACVLSTEAVIDEGNAILEPRLLGTWQAPADSDRVTITQGPGKTYRFAHTDRKDDTAHFAGRFGLLGGRMVLDLWPADSSVDAPEGDLFVAHHLLLSIDMRDREVRVALLEPDSVRVAVRAGTMRNVREVSGGRVVLTGSTDELRTTLADYLGRPGVFAGEGVWVRGP